jgi:uncharacterized protein (DUF2252 family)
MAEAVSSIKPSDRARVLIANRQAKMAESAHAYVRGNTLSFYEWLKKHSAQTIPEGPPIWICGDCHVGNVGPLADSDGKVEIPLPTTLPEWSVKLTEGRWMQRRDHRGGPN